MLFRSMQGMRTLYDKTVGDDRQARTQKALGLLAFVGLVAAFVGYAGSDKDEDGISKYYKIPDYKRDSRIILKEGIYGINLPQEASLFYILGNAVGDSVFGPASTGESVARVLKNMLAQLSPLGTGQADPFSHRTNISDYLLRMYAPSLSQPILDLATNKDTFGRTIVPNADDSPRYLRLLKHEKYRNTENKTSIAIAKYLHDKDIAEVAPPQITALAKFLEGGAVTSLMGMINPKPEAYPGAGSNTLGKRFSTAASPYEDAQAYKDAQYELRNAVSRPNPTPLARSLLARIEATNKATAEFWKGSTKMTPEQVKVAERRSTAMRTAIMKDYYLYTGAVKK